MPHIILEHSSNFSNSLAEEISVEIKKIMKSLVEGNFDPNQCKIRSFSFDKYWVGESDSNNSSFFHVTIKILSGRDILVRKKLAEMTSVFIQEKIFNQLPSPHRTDISVDIVEMYKETYQKITLEI